MKIKRYALEIVDTGNCRTWDSVENKKMVENEIGGYVLYDDIKHLLERSDNNDYAKCREDILMLLTSGGEIEREQIDTILKKHFA